MKKFLCIFLALVMLVGMLPTVVVANGPYTITSEVTPTTIMKSDSTQDITVSFTTTSAFDACMIAATIDKPEGWEILSITNDQVGMTLGDVNLDKGIISWESSDIEDFTGLTKIATVTLRVPANAVGDFQVVLKDIDIKKEYAGTDVISGSYTAPVTISEPPAPASGFSIYYKNAGTDDDTDKFYEVDPGKTSSFDIYVKSDTEAYLQAFDIYPAFGDKVSVSYADGASITSHTGQAIKWHTDHGGHLQSVSNALNLHVPAYDAADPTTEIKIATITVKLDNSAVYDTQYPVYFNAQTNLAVGGTPASAVIATGGVDTTGTMGLETLKTYTVQYNANTTDTVSGLPTNQTKQHNVNLTLSAAAPVRNGWTFKGWSLEQVDYSTDEDIDYAAGATTYNVNADQTLYALWNQDFFTVTWYAPDGQTVLGTSTVASGAKPAYPTDPNWQLPEKPANTPQYSYGDLVWATAAGQTGGTALAELPAVTEDVSYYAVYPQTTNRYTITWKSWDGNTTYGIQEVEYGQEPALPEGVDVNDINKAADTKYTYTFANWSDTVQQLTTGKLPADLPNVTGDATYYAAFTTTGQTYTVTLDPNGGTPAPDPVPTVPVTYGEGEQTLPTTVDYTKEGYEFSGWNTSSDGTGTDVNTVSNLEADQTVYAKWTPITYTVHFDGNDASSGTMEDQEFTYDANPPVALRANAFHKKITGMDGKEYVFVGWSKNPSPALGATADLADQALIGLGNNLSSTKNATVNLYAIWKQADYKIEYTMNDGNNCASNPTSYDTNKLPLIIDNTKNQPTKRGYTFTGWTTEDIAGYTTPSKTVTIPAGTTGDITLVANWTANDVGYTVKFWQQDLNDTDNTAYTEMPDDAQHLSGRTGETTTVDYSSTAIKDKYSGFLLNLEKSDKNTTILGDGRTVINVYYNRKTYHVSYSYTNDPAITGTPAVPTDTTEYRHGASVTPTAVADITGYTFSGWTPNPGVINAADLKFTGSWTAKNVGFSVEFYQQNLTDEKYTKIGNDTLMLDGYADANTAIDFTTYASKYAGFEMRKHDENTTIARDGSTVIKIYYDRLSYEVTYSYTNDPVPTGATPLDQAPYATVSYKFGAPVELAPVAAAPGYDFGGWQKDGANAPASFTMPAASVAITGTFTAHPYTIHFESGASGIDAPADISYDITKGITMPAALTGRTNYTFVTWRVTTADGNWTVNTDYDASNQLAAGLYGDVTLTAVWSADFNYSVEEYKYAPTGYVMLIVEDKAANDNIYSFDNQPMFYTNDASYQMNGNGVYIYLIPNSYIVDVNATPKLLTDGGIAKISEVTGTKTEIDYTSGDINGDGKTNIADANAVYQMLYQEAKGGYYTLDLLDIRGRLMADMDRTTTDDHRGSIEDVNAIVDIINGTNSNP